MKENLPLKAVYPDKKLTNHCARKMVLKKLKSSGIPKCEIKNHWPQLRARIRWLLFRWWKQTKNYVQHHPQCHKWRTSTPTSLLSGNSSQSSLQLQPLQCDAQHRWKPFFTVKSQPEQAYAGKNGLCLNKVLSTLYTIYFSNHCLCTICFWKTKTSFYLDQGSSSDAYILLEITGRSAEAQYIGKGNTTENRTLPNGFVNKNVVSMARFKRVGSACNIITLDDNKSQAFTFTPKSFTFSTLDLMSLKDSTLLTHWLPCRP